MSQYRGRFAPSPTGPLHLGSLVAAVASYLDARAHGGKRLVRIEDLDTVRCSARWADEILRTLEAFAMAWDGDVWFQSYATRQQAYTRAFETLASRGLVYPCSCSRKEIEDSLAPNAQVGPERRYPGTCREKMAAGRPARAWRVRVSGEPIEFTDRALGPQRESLEETIGDFVLKRADGPYSYQLAVVVDDADQGITHVVRGADLLSSTARQVYLQQLLGYPQPHYWHVGVVTNAAGEKLSKQTGAAPLDIRSAPALLVASFQFLGLAVPEEIRNATIAELWAWAFESFRPVERFNRQHLGTS